MMKSAFCLFMLLLFFGTKPLFAARISLKPATVSASFHFQISPEVRPVMQYSSPGLLNPSAGSGGLHYQPNGAENKQSSAVTGRRYSFKERLTLKYLKNYVKKLGMREGGPTDPRRLRQGRLALILGAGAFVVVFIPFLQLLSPLMAIAAIALGIVSVQGNSNLPGILGICFGGAFLLLILLVVAILVLTFSFW
jgi:hypothetical protein